MSGFICISNRALHDYTWTVCGFFIICIRWLLLAFYFFFLIFMHCIIFLFVTRAQFYGWVNPAGVLRMFYSSFQKSVVLCWMSAWMKITLKERGILALNQSPESLITILETAGLCAKEHMPCHFLWFYQFVILIPQYPVSQKTILKTQISCTKSSVSNVFQQPRVLLVSWGGGITNTRFYP